MEIELRKLPEAVTLLDGIAKLHESEFPKHLQHRVQDKIERAQELLQQVANSSSRTGKQ
jgi:hypothetical protein